MRPRTVIITVEVTTTVPVNELKARAIEAFGCQVKQLQVNVIKDTKKGKSK